MNCERCLGPTDGRYGSGRFCGSKCARGFSTANNRVKISQKVSGSLTGRSKYIKIEKICPTCLKSFIQFKRPRTFCSNKCRVMTQETKNKIGVQARNRVINGTHNTWTTRPNLSYAEQFFVKVLDSNGFKDRYIVNKYVSKRDLGLDQSSGYFLDFYFPEFKLDLEIDGKQHRYPDRIKSDLTRDSVLADNGFEVYRIEWNEIKTQAGQDLMKEKIDKFIGKWANQVSRLLWEQDIMRVRFSSSLQTMEMVKRRR